MKFERKIPSYIKRAKKDGLFLGFIYLLVFMSIFTLAIWQIFESRYNSASIGIIAIAFNLRAYDFISQELKAAEDPEFETFYTKNILLNEGIRLWMAVQDQPHENFQFAEEVLPRGNSL